MRIQEIAEELVNLSVREVQELSMIMKNNCDMPQIASKYYDSRIQKRKKKSL